MKGILGIEAKKLTAADYCDDPRSTIVDESSTIVMGGTQVKVLAWYVRSSRHQEAVRSRCRGQASRGKR